MAKVLVADIPAADETIRECLPGHDLHFVRTLGQAMRELTHNGYQMIVIGMHFDESRMFALMQFVRSLPRYSRTPIICVRGMPSILSSAAREGIRHAVLAAGGDAFVDFGLTPADLGELRERLAGLVRGEAPVNEVFDEPHSSLRH